MPSLVLARSGENGCFVFREQGEQQALVISGEIFVRSVLPWVLESTLDWGRDQNREPAGAAR